jgi:hypothetical protein
MSWVALFTFFVKGRVAEPLGLNFRVADPSPFFEGSEGLDSPSHLLTSVHEVNPAPLTIAANEMQMAAPGMANEFVTYREGGWPSFWLQVEPAVGTGFSDVGYPILASARVGILLSLLKLSRVTPTTTVIALHNLRTFSGAGQPRPTNTLRQHTPISYSQP